MTPQLWQVEPEGGIFLPQIGWHLDSRFPKARSFVSHAHFDHMARHRVILCSDRTRRLMARRLPGNSEIISLPFGQMHRLDDGTEIKLHPAGHILGSAQLAAKNHHGSFLYTGDFKLRPGLSAETCVTPHADTLVMETTYGVPRYEFPPFEEVAAGIRKFCYETLSDKATPVLFGYSLGKSQEILSALKEARVPIMLHPQVEKMTRVYEECGFEFPLYGRFDEAYLTGHVVICPPQSTKSTWFQNLRRKRTATITGWGLDSSTRYRSGCDAVFPLSDHADYNDLLRFVERVNPSRVYTVHGFAQEFSQTLRTRGIEAWALGKDNQLELKLN
ncbi:MAG: MBL fold metallo-hydrolase [Verrucomicrobia bacterium]|nr:MAG: MBL fold metallo-hydrolase [Verrucomicrobiota bacterium]